jgi:hypothetical protein
MAASAQMPLALKLGYGLAVPIIAVVYWREYGPANFLWLSDIALACTAISVLTGNRLLASMPAVGVLPLELAWTVDFLAGGQLIGLAGYMYDAKLPLYLRLLSLFHLALPPTVIYILYTLGYDRRAGLYQTLVTWAVFLAAYLLTSPDKNINWVFGPGEQAQQTLPPFVYLSLVMVIVPLFVILPMHILLRRLFPARI